MKFQCTNIIVSFSYKKILLDKIWCSLLELQNISNVRVFALNYQKNHHS